VTPNARARVSPSAEIQRRTFLGGVASLLVTASVAAEPHRVERPLRIGYLSPTVSTPLEAGWLQEWRIALSRRGYPEHVVTLEERYAGDRLERLPTLATELVRVRADLLLTFATQATLAAKAATAAIPIVMIAVGDPIGVGIVRSLNRPESNITGLALSNVDTAGKRLEFLKQAVPGLSRVAVLTNPRNEALTNLHMAQTQQVAERLGIALDRQAVTGPEHLAATFAAVVRQGVNGVLVLPDPVLSRTGSESPSWPSTTGCRPPRPRARSSKRDAFSPTDLTWPRSIDRPHDLSTGFSGAPSPRIFRSSNRPNLNWSSISKQPRLFGCGSRRGSSCGRTT